MVQAFRTRSFAPAVQLGGPSLPSGAAVDLNFMGASYFPDPVVTNSLSISRASTGYATNADGTLTSFASGALRIGVGTGLLVEESRTNLVLQSQFASGWTGSAAGLNTNFAAAPDGTTTAAQLINNATTNVHEAYSAGFTITSGTTYTISLYVQPTTGRYLTLTMQSALTNGWISATFDLSLGTNTQTGAGTAATFTSASITPFGSFFRLTVTGNITNTTGYFDFSFAPSGTPTYGNFGNTSYLGNSTDAFLVWGAQVEQASFPTSYIPTTTTTATRAADVVSFLGLSLSTIQGAAGSAHFQGTGTIPTTAIMFSNAAANEYLMYVSSSTSLQQFASGTGLSSAFLGSGTTAGLTKGDTGWSAGTVSLVANNGTLVNRSGTFAGTTVWLGTDGFNPYDSYIQRVALWNSRLPDATLQNYSWMLDPNAAVDMDFADGLYYPSAVTSLLTCSRSSTGYVQNGNGTLTSIASNTLRIGTGPSAPGLLVEESRTNLFLQSQFGGTWSQFGASTLTPNFTTAPDGTTTAATLVESSTTNSHGTVQNVTKAASSLSYVVSFYVKRSATGSTRNAEVDVGDSGIVNGVYAQFDLGTGAIIASGAFGTGWGFTSAGTQQLANGWWRIWIVLSSSTGTLISSAAFILNVTSNYAGDGSSGLYIWGAQLEQASFPTSYIPTTTTTVTRAAEVVQCSATPYGVLSGAAVSTYVQVGQTIKGNGRVIGSTHSANTEAVPGVNSGQTLMQLYNGTSSLSATPGSGTPATASLKTACSWSVTGRSIVCANGTVATDSNTVPADPTYYLGGDDNAGTSETFDGYIQRVVLWSSRLPDAYLKALTK